MVLDWRNMKKKKKKLRLKKKFRILFTNIFKLIFLILVCIAFCKILFKKNLVESIKFDEKIIVNIKENKNKEIYCLITNQKNPSIDSENWIKAENNICYLEYVDGNNYLYIKNNKKIISTNKNEIVYIDTSKKEKVYLAIGDEFDYINAFIGDENAINIVIKDQKVATANKDGIIKGLSEGKTTINYIYEETDHKIEVIVTDLITIAPKGGYDYEKDYLPCEEYSEEENNLIDEILKDRINDVGYKTRAGVVEAASFLTLEFPYRINYFYENGRQTTNNVDGEGRYYHEGLYLHSTRYEDITGKSTGPKMWGCSLYSNPAHRYIDNGLDCSGFVSWVLLNAGFDVKDVGAGLSVKSDLTDFGDMKKLTKELSTNGSIKVGDLLHSYAAGGHIAIIVGSDEDYYYVAQALWYDEIGVIITKHKKEKLKNDFAEIVYMDEYYKEDGKLTNMW